jgi:hypothetical protein
MFTSVFLISKTEFESIRTYIYNSSSLVQDREFRLGMMSMAHEARTHSGGPHLVPIVVDGLRKNSLFKRTRSERVTLSESEPISALWGKLKCECDSSLVVNPRL